MTALPPKTRHKVLIIGLCILLPDSFLSAESALNISLPKLDSNQRTVHFLNRFTFGPTPESIARIQKIGADAWFEEQIHPMRTPEDAELERRLVQFPALQLPVDQLMERFPNGAEIRRTISGKRGIPNDPTLAAIYRRHISLTEDKQARKTEQQAKQELASATDSKQAASTVSDSSEVDKASASTMESVAPSVVVKPEMQAPSARRLSADSIRPRYGDVLVKTVLALPPAQRVNRILMMQSDEFNQFYSSLKGPARRQLTQDLDPGQRELLADFENPTRTVIEELQSERLMRDIYSPHQLQELMTTFWLNHFNVFIHKNEETPYFLVSYERDVIAPRALGNFEDLLVATAESPAMLVYLDNNTSTGPNSITAQKQRARMATGKAKKDTPPGLNENYARELMELHTLGVNGGYTQKDVTEVAKVFTGWTLQGTPNAPVRANRFHFDESRHEPGRKIVLGRKIKENGQKEGLQVLHMLATSPATAHFISQELAVEFVGDSPPASLINRMAQAFAKTQGDISAVLRTVVRSPEFWTPNNYQKKVKTPLEYVVSAARASNADIVNYQPFINSLNQLGMPLYGCVPPTGYSDKADAWVSTGALVSRMNFALSFANNRFQGITTNWGQTSVITDKVLWDAGTSGAPEAEEQYLENRILPVGASEKTRSAVLSSAQALDESQKKPATSGPAKPAGALGRPVAAPQPNVDRQSAQIAGLLIGSPEFQHR